MDSKAERRFFGVAAQGAAGKAGSFGLDSD